MYQTIGDRDYRVANAAMSRKRTRKPVRKKSTGVKSKKRSGSHGGFRIVMSIMLVVIMACLIIYNDIKITTLSKETSVLKAELESYKDENVQLKYEYEKAYSSSAVEEYAKNILNMSLVDKSQIEYIELSNEDKIETAAASEGTGFLILSEILKLFGVVVEYLN